MKISYYELMIDSWEFDIAMGAFGYCIGIVTGALIRYGLGGNFPVLVVILHVLGAILLIPIIRYYDTVSTKRCIKRIKNNLTF